MNADTGLLRNIAWLALDGVHRRHARDGHRLFLQVDRDNRRARALYRSRDYVPLRREHLVALRHRAE